MEIIILDPTAHHGWDKMLQQSGNSYFFHTQAWARVLKESYGFKPLYIAIFEGKSFAFLLPFMEVNSLFTGRRGVSLPFTDSCPPHTTKEIDFSSITNKILDHGRRAGWLYFECRAADILFTAQTPTQTYLTHDLDLARPENKIFSDFSSSTRRNIRNSAKSRLFINIDNSIVSLKSFYRLHCITRKRHGIPPQPFSFFQRIHDFVISQGYGIIVTARQSKRCIASSIYFCFGNQAIFKYGASDYSFKTLGGNNAVMWEAIKWFRSRGFLTLSFGRTDIDNQGLLRYKRNWGAVESQIRYYRFIIHNNSPFQIQRNRITNIFSGLSRILPIPLLRLIGRIAYRHID